MGSFWDNGTENGSYYSILGFYIDEALPLQVSQTPKRDLKIRSPRTIYGKIYKDYIGVRMGLYRGSNF